MSAYLGGAQGALSHAAAVPRRRAGGLWHPALLGCHPRDDL